MVALATPQDMIARYDVRRLGDLLSDNDIRLQPDMVVNSSLLMEHLLDASSMVVSALLAGGKVNMNQIQEAISGPSNPARNLLVRVTCDLAFGFLLRRRGFSAKDVAFMAPGFSVAEQMLQQMRSGVFVLPTTSVEKSSFPKKISIATSPGYVTDEMRRVLSSEVWDKRK